RRRTPDLVLDQHAVTAEAKRLDEATANAVTQNIRSARGQSARVVIDGRQAGLDEATATRGLNRALRLYGLQLREVVILLGDGRAIGWGRGS
ncbi:MAG: hypothetical protein JWO46_1816, partial [Nocardioidaceae bacterium]|nr:hypothetical protein [Nocardioidaceae bacterium]